jgi:hypothetical protein
MVGGPQSEYWAKASLHFPPSSEGLLEGHFYSPTNPLNARLNKVILKVIRRRKIDKLQELLSPEYVDNKSLTKADVVDGMARSGVCRIYNEPLKPTDLPLSNEDFIAYSRFILGLPPRITINNSTVQPNFDYPVQACLSTHDIKTSPYLDANGAHAGSNCKATYQARYRKHNSIARALGNAARQAGLEVKLEPDTHSLLLGDFSKEECHRIFPKDASPTYKAKFAELLTTINQLDNDPSISIEQRQVILKPKIEALPVLNQDPTGLRVDISMEDPVTGEQKLIDVTITHTTSASYIAQEFKAVVQRQTSSNFAKNFSLPDPIAQDPSPTLVNKEKQKSEKYSRLIAVATKQHAQRKRRQAPTFSPFALADNGELGTPASHCQEWIVEHYRRSLTRDPQRLDGITIPQLVRDFRHELKMNVLFALVAGFGATLNAAGQPKLFY